MAKYKYKSSPGLILHLILATEALQLEVNRRKQIHEKDRALIIRTKMKFNPVCQLDQIWNPQTSHMAHL